MRVVLAAVFGLASAVGCAELGVVTDGTSISYGRPNRGRLIDGVKLPDNGPGFTTAHMWKTRGNRFGTDELVTLLKNVSRRMKKKSKDARLVVADLSGTGGGAAHAFHRSHQSGRDVDLLYYVRDAEGKSFEPETMRAFTPQGVAKDGSGVTLDVARTWQLVRELLTAQEAYVQYIFMYRPIVEKVIEHATQAGEPEELIARATMALKQPGDSAPHNDHMHVRIYCPPNDRMWGCVDIGPLELLAVREAEARQTFDAIATALPPATEPDDEDVPLERTAADVWNEAATKASRTSSPLSAAPPGKVSGGAASATTAASSSDAFSSLLRASSHNVDLRGWR